MEEIKITDELIKTIYGRIEEFANSKYGRIPDEIILEGDYFTIKYEGNWNHIDVYYIAPTDLNSDLDEIRKERLAKIEEDRIKRLELQRVAEEKRKIQEKADRKRMYLSLKKEFETAL